MAAFWTLALLLFAGSACSARQLSNRITGGEPATIESNPSIIQIQRVSGMGDTWIMWCGGTIINNRYALSAATCYDNIRNLRIRAGAQRSGINSPGTIVHILGWNNHPTFGQQNNYDGDIAVVQFVQFLTFGPTINMSPIISQDVEVPDNTLVTYCGFGYLQDDPQSTNFELQCVTTRTVNRATCRRAYSDSEETHNVTENMICAGEEGRGHCTDDEGGPLIYDNILIGIISWAAGCGEGRYPGVCTRLSSYTRWVSENTVNF